MFDAFVFFIFHSPSLLALLVSPLSSSKNFFLEMPSKKNARKQRENKTAAQDRPAFIASLKQFKEDGTGSVIDPMLVSQFPLFHGKAPPGHPYPQAFTEGATDETYCYVEMVEEDLVLLRRRLPSGRVIWIDTCEFAMLNGSVGIAHRNMDNGDNRVANLAYVTEAEARRLLLEYVWGVVVTPVRGGRALRP